MLAWFYFTDVAGLENVVGLRIDIAQAYDANGFNMPLAFAETIVTNQNARRPEPLFTDALGTHYRIALDLSAATIAVGSRLYLAFLVDKRNSFPPYLDFMNQNPGITFGTGDYSFAEIPVLDKSAGDGTLAHLIATIPLNPHVYLTANDQPAWGSPELP